ncbi:hypothetical protein L1987_32491 [Smallanthus sonchifolius]|uniref:Uncharacterized protein n=1 Tax=Smallanthus sonchifolius TaxID=185202 RepID=A0ACB9HPL1_9ASTR|nr:hypothetical protein L1987_32491 [Smallanthus sonchifolius]
MGNDDASASNTKTTFASHPAYTVSNINNKIKTLDGHKITYSTWVKFFLLHTTAYKVTNHIDGTAAPDKTDPNYEEWKEIDALVLQWIYNTISDELVIRIVESNTTANAAWKKLQNIYLSNKGSRAAALDQEFTTLTLASCSSIDEYCQKLHDLANQLKDVDQPVSESRLVLQLVRGLPVESDVVASLINQTPTTWDNARNMIQLEQQRLAARQNASVLVTPRTGEGSKPQQTGNQQPSGNNVQTGQQPGNNVQTGPQQYDSGSRSYFRGRGRGRNNSRGGGRYGGRGRPHYNYSESRPPYNWAGPWWNGPPPCPYPTQPAWNYPGTQYSGNHRPNSQNQGNSQAQHAHVAYDSSLTAPSPPNVNALSPTELGAALSAMTLNTPDPHWYMDTGASSHLTSNTNDITTLITKPCNDNILVGDGNTLPITGSGHGLKRVDDKTYNLNNILVAPQIIKNLLSVRKFTRDNLVSIEFDPYGFTLKDLKSGRILSRHNSTGDLYPFTSSHLACLTSSSNKWHNRLGHPGRQSLNYLSSRFFIPCNKDSTDHFCHSCQVSNSKRLPFVDSNSVTFAPFDIIHCDLWTSPIISKSGYKYYMVLIDNFSQFVWVYPLKFKSEAFTNFAKFHKLIQTQFHKSIRAFQCDLGGEFDNRAFHTFANAHGLMLRFSCPQTSPQNGKAERMIRRLNDIIRATLMHAHLPPTFWVEALHTATYLHNILPTKTLNFNTPTFALYQRHPTYDHLRVFGCACYPNQTATQPHKLHPRSIRCIFLGYPSNFRGYRCLDPHTGKVHLSRHVTFDEESFPFTDPNPTDAYKFLDDEQTPFHHFQFPSSSTQPNPPTHPPVIHNNEIPNQTPHSPTSLTPSPNPTHTQNTNSPPPNHPAPNSPTSTSPAPTPNSPPNETYHPNPTINTHPMTTRGKVGISKPNPHFNLNTTTSKIISPLPSSYQRALSDPHWKQAMTNEFKALQDNGTWELVPRPESSPVIRCMWLFRHKFKSDGSLERYKARLVVNGKSQTVGIDCDETFSPVVKPATIRTVLSLALSKQWPIHQLDVKNAFLHGDLQETIYMHQPPGFVDSTAPHYVCRLRKSLYGLKQAPRAWFNRFSTFIISQGFKSSLCDNSLFVYRQGTNTAYLLLYVDDIVLTASSTEFLNKIISSLSTEFAMTDLGSLHHFLGITVTRDSQGLFLSQSQYAKDILHRANMSSCKPCATPVDTSSKLSACVGAPLVDGTLYRSLAGALQYLTFTRPDISYAVQQVCLFMHDPREPHYNFMKRILRYIQGTLDYGLRLTGSKSISLTAYSDADWGGCPDSRRSTSGYCVYMGNNLISWSSKRQNTISRSSAEAEYRGVANAVAETSWLRNLLLELHVPIDKAIIVYCDNISAVYLSENPVQHQRTKHVEIDIHFVREKVRLGQIRVLHVPSTSQYADIFTKGLPRTLFQDFRSSLNVQQPPAQTAGEY